MSRRVRKPNLKENKSEKTELLTKDADYIPFKEDLHWLVQPRTKFKLICGLVYIRSGESIDHMKIQKHFLIP